MKNVHNPSERGSNGWHVTSPAPRDVWEEIVKSDPKALVDRTPAWVDCVCAAGAYEDASCLYESSTGRRLVLPMARRRHLPTPLTTQASLPSGDMGGLIAPGGVRPEEVAAVFADRSGRPFLRTSILPNALAGELWAAASPPGVMWIPRLAHVVDLEGGFERVFAKRFSRQKRTNVGKAERAGLVVECDTTGKLVPVFYDLMRLSFDRWGWLLLLSDSGKLLTERYLGPLAV